MQKDRYRYIQLASLFKILKEKEDHSVYVLSDLYIKLIHYSSKLTKLDTDNCNGTVSDETYTAKSDKVISSIAELLKPFSLYFYHQSDPRGASLYLADHPLTAQNYNNGIAII